jgi:hypothetical protein
MANLQASEVHYHHQNRLQKQRAVEVRVLKAELGKARADTAAAVSLATERELSGLGGSVDGRPKRSRVAA